MYLRPYPTSQYEMFRKKSFVAFKTPFQPPQDPPQPSSHVQDGLPAARADQAGSALMGKVRNVDVFTCPQLKDREDSKNVEIRVSEIETHNESGDKVVEET
jgi:hypothetical protein